MQASMASGVVDICLIPEITFSLSKLAEHVDSILQRKGNCVICVAEGAGQVRIVFASNFPFFFPSFNHWRGL